MCDIVCPLCCGKKINFLCRFINRDYYRCDECVLAFVPAFDHLSATDEVLRYDKHNNTSDSPGYVKYLEEVAGYLSKIPLEKPKVLDFGCYKTEVLVSILEGQGYDCKGYDPCYGVGLSNISQKYDVVIMCEVIEHLCNINKEISLLKTLLNEQTGYILIRTELYSKDKDIEKWWYANDETHIFLPSEHSIALIAEKLSRKIIYSDGRRYLILGPTGLQ